MGNLVLKGRTMTCIVILEATAKKGTGMQLVETFGALLPDTRNKDGLPRCGSHDQPGQR